MWCSFRSTDPNSQTRSSRWRRLYDQWIHRANDGSGMRSNLGYSSILICHSGDGHRDLCNSLCDCLYNHTAHGNSSRMVLEGDHLSVGLSVGSSTHDQYVWCLPKNESSLIIKPLGFIALGKHWYGPVSGNWCVDLLLEELTCNEYRYRCWLVEKPVYMRYVLTHGWRFLFIFLEICLYGYLVSFLSNFRVTSTEKEV